MKTTAEQIPITTQRVGVDPAWDGGESDETEAGKSFVATLFSNSEFGNVVETVLTTLAIFGIYLIQGIVVARLLGPLGRGEFGTAMFFPRDVFLYAGLLGGMEIVNSYAAKGTLNIRTLKYSAAKLGLISGGITAIFSALVATLVLVPAGKTYLIPYCLVCCLFVPWEHMQLTISAVDRGTRSYRFYNVNRLLFALSFLILVVIVFGLRLNTLTRFSSLSVICFLFVFARVIGILPTLRGMHVLQVVRQRVRARPAGALRPETGSDSDVVSVPGPLALLKNGRFYAISMLASETFERLDMFLIVAIASVAESGYYFVAVPAVQLLMVGPSALSVFTFNAGADKERLVTLKQLLSAMGLIAAFQIMSAIILAVLLPILILTFYKQPFAPAIPFARWLLPACAIKGYLAAVDGFLKGRDKPMIGVRARFLSIFLMLGFVGLVYGGIIPGPEQKLLSIPMAACLGQAISMVIISIAAIQDTLDRESEFVKKTIAEGNDGRY